MRRRGGQRIVARKQLDAPWPASLEGGTALRTARHDCTPARWPRMAATAARTAAGGLAGSRGAQASSTPASRCDTARASRALLKVRPRPRPASTPALVPSPPPACCRPRLSGCHTARPTCSVQAVATCSAPAHAALPSSATSGPGALARAASPPPAARPGTARPLDLPLPLPPAGPPRPSPPSPVPRPGPRPLPLRSSLLSGCSSTWGQVAGHRRTLVLWLTTSHVGSDGACFSAFKTTTAMHVCQQPLALTC